MRSCSICEKGYKKGKSRSHSNRSHIRKLQANLQWLTLSTGKRVKACTRCVKSASRGKIKTK